METYKTYKPVADDTKALKNMLTENGLRVKECKKNGWVVYINTDNNIKALELIEKAGYELNTIYRKTLEISEVIFQSENMMFEKVQK